MHRNNANSYLNTQAPLGIVADGSYHEAATIVVVVIRPLPNMRWSYLTMDLSKTL